MRSFLKWAGNKYQIMHHLLKSLPPGKRLVEPFTGSGAVFLNTDYPRYLLGDNNFDLINLFQMLKKEKTAFIDYCKSYFCMKYNKETIYYQFRDQFNETDEPMIRAALFLYLNRHGYNGLCRYNSKGGFNVPFGRHKKPYFPYNEMQHFIKKAKGARFVHLDFAKVMRQAKPGDVVYCDPPYAPLSDTAKFTSYSPTGFDESQQCQLALEASKLAAKGIPVIISNHYTDFICDIYQHAELNIIEVPRFISCNTRDRNPVQEVIAVFT